MDFIKNILLLNIADDIKKVIDLEDQTETEIQYEIENYIITPKLSDYFAKFIHTYKSNITETGVWISGFYGSGKSYFGKNLGHILANKTVNGTPARDRFIQRLHGLKNEGLLENEIRSLTTLNNRVIFLDVAKQHTDKGGLAWTLFRIFLKSLGFLDNAIGYLEYSLFLNDDYTEFLKKAKDFQKAEWDVAKKNIQHPITFRKILTSYKYSDSEYEDLKHSADFAIENFDASKLRDHLVQYFEKVKDERIVFIFDEASEAIGQRKFTLLDLEGISESLSSLTRRVWTIAIAQEKLDDVIHNANVSKNQLVKLTDRFKTQLHLESTEVEYIIKNRLLGKNDAGLKLLKDQFTSKSGQISNVTNLKASFGTVCESADEFATFYPFHKYQFRLLQNFLFKSNILAKTQIAERGMIITVFDVLRNRLKDKKLFHTSSSYDIASEGQLNPPIQLSNKYDKAKKKLEQAGLDINGESLLKVVHFLTESENEAVANIDNITKCYQYDLEEDYYKLKGRIEKAMQELVEADLVIESSGIFKIASDQEQKLKTEMYSMQVELYIRKRNLIDHLKALPFIKGLGNVTVDATPFNYSVQSDLDDDLVNSSNKNLKVKVFSLYSFDSELSKFIENQKAQSISEKSTIFMIPNNSKFNEIDKLFEEIYRYEQIENRYGNDNDQNLRQIVRNFSTIKQTKQSRLQQLISDAYQNATVIYRNEEKVITPDNYKTVLVEFQKRLVNNVYTKKLSTQLSEDLAKSVLKETEAQHLRRLFSGNEFDFFDANGNFIGEHLKLTEELVFKMKNTFIDGRSLETALSEPPCGYTFGTINTTLAVLIRSGRLVTRYNGREIFDYKDPDVMKIFTTSREYQKASFKVITKTLSASQKNELVNVLLDIKVKDIIDKAVGYNTTDFELVDSITIASDILIDRLKTSQKNTKNFEKLFPNAASVQSNLKQYTYKTTESNYIEKAELFLAGADAFKESVKTIKTIESFIHKKLPQAEKYAEFVKRVSLELDKISGEAKSASFVKLIEGFNEIFNNNITEKYSDLEKQTQKIKDAYFNLLEKDHSRMASSYLTLKSKTEELIQKIESVSKEANQDLLNEAGHILDYSNKRICRGLEIEYDTQCSRCSFSLYEVSLSNENISQKFEKLLDLESKIRTEKKIENSKEPTPPQPRKVNLKLSKGVITAGEYKKILKSQLNDVEQLDNYDKIDLSIQIEE